MKARLKQKEVEFIRHTGPNTLVVMTPSGEKRAQPGDIITFTKVTLVNEPEKTIAEKIITAKDFADQYEVIAESKTSGDEGDAGDWTEAGDGTDYPKTDLSGNKMNNGHNFYNLPHFDTIEEAQAAAQEFYAPKEGVVNTTVYQATIGSTNHVYAIQPSGVVNQVPVAMQDSTADPGFPTTAGMQADRFPAVLANQNQTVREGVDGEDRPVTNFQRNNEDTPAHTFGEGINQPGVTEQTPAGDHPEDNHDENLRK